MLFCLIKHSLDNEFCSITCKLYAKQTLAFMHFGFKWIALKKSFCACLQPASSPFSMYEFPRPM